MIDELATLLAPEQNGTPIAEMWTGEVTDASVSPPLIMAGHSTTAVPTPCLGSYIPQTGDFVSVLVAGAARVCLGKADGAMREQFAYNGANWAPILFTPSTVTRVGGRGYLDLAQTQRLNATTGAANVLIGTIPVGYRPSFTGGVLPVVTNGNVAGLINITSGGLVQWRGDISGTAMVANSIVNLCGINWPI